MQMRSFSWREGRAFLLQDSLQFLARHYLYVIIFAYMFKYFVPDPYVASTGLST